MKKKLLITNLVNLSVIILFMVFFDSYTISYANQVEYNSNYVSSSNNTENNNSSYEMNDKEDSYSSDGQENEVAHMENDSSLSSSTNQNISNNNDQNGNHQDNTNNQNSSNQDSANQNIPNKETTTTNSYSEEDNNFSSSSSTDNNLTSDNSDTYNDIINKNDKLGTLGRLYIPSQNLNVAVYYANAFGNGEYTAQAIVDKVDSAAYYEFGPHHIIADHNYQGFKKIINLNVGDKAYLKTANNQIITFRLKEKFAGYNLKSDLVDTNNNSIQTKEESLVMYTCYKEGNSIMITLWEQIN